MPPTIDASFYFNGNAKLKNGLERDIPIYAFHLGVGHGHEWASGPVQSRGGFESLASRVNIQVPVHIALPYAYASRLFLENTRISKLTLYAFASVRGIPIERGYMSGLAIAIVFSDVLVGKSEPILQWKGLPAPVSVQRFHLENKLKMGAYKVSNVKLMAEQANVLDT